MSLRYDDLSKEELVRLLEARDQRDSNYFGLVWEANEIERDKALNNDFVALDLVAVEKDMYEGASAAVVVVNGKNDVLHSVNTRIGGEQ